MVENMLLYRSMRSRQNEHELRPEALASIARDMTIFSHPTRIAEAVDELWGGALRYEEEL